MCADAWNLKGVLKSSVPSDELEVVFNVGQDPTKDKAGMTFDFTQNGRKMIGVTAELTRANGLIDFTKIVSTQSIRDVIQAIMEGNIIDHAAEPMQQSIIVVRQLVQALQKMQNAFYDSVKSK